MKLLLRALVVLLFIALFGLYFVRSGASFDFGRFLVKLGEADYGHVLGAATLIYLTVVIRAYRWWLFIRKQGQTQMPSLIGPQFIGFSCVTLFGSLGDLTRPYLIAKKSGRSFSSQLATYTLERSFDLGALGCLILACFLMSQTAMGLGKTLSSAVLYLCAMLLFLFLFYSFYKKSPALARWVAKTLSPSHPGASQYIVVKLEQFQAGFSLFSSFSDLLRAALASLSIWILVAISFYLVAHGFSGVPELREITTWHIAVLVSSSIGGTLIQLPFIGWFTQTAVMTWTIHALLNAPMEESGSCALLLLCVTFIFLLPAGVLFSSVEGVSLYRLARASENNSGE